MKRKINLSYEMLIGLLQGKEIRLVEGDNEILLAPPFDGVFLTYDQIREIQYSSEERVFTMLQKVLEAQQETHNV